MANVFEMVFKAVDKATAPIRKINKVTKGFQTGIKNAGAATAKAFAVGAFAGLVTLTGLLTLGVNKAIAFESSMADVKKVVGDGFKSPEEFKKFGDDILAMSRVIPVAASGLAEISAEAAASGIALEDNLRFTEFAAKSAVAFDTTAGAIGESFAKIRNVYQLNQDGLEGMSNAVNHLSNNMAAKAPQIIDFINRAGGAAPLLGASAEQMAALGASLIAVGVVPETAARGMNALATRLEIGGKKITGAFKDIGLNYKTFKAGLKSDPGGSLKKLFDAIDKSPKGTAALKELVGQDFVDDFLKLAKRTDLLANSFDLLGDKAAMAGSVQAEYEARAATTANNMQLLRNNVDALGIAVGSRLLPPINDALKAINQFLAGMGDGTSALEQALSSVSAFFGDFTSSFSQSFDGINDKFLALGSALSGLGDTVSSLFSLITGETETFGTSMGAMFGSVIEVGLQAFTGLVTGISSIFEAVTNRFGLIKESLLSVFEVFGRLGSAVSKLFAAFGVEGNGFASFIVDVLVFSLLTLSNTLKIVVESLTFVIDKFADFVNFVSSGIESLDWEKLKPDFSDWKLPSLKFWKSDADEAAKSIENINKAANDNTPASFKVSDPAALEKAANLTKQIAESQKAITQEAGVVLAAVQNMVNTANTTLQSVDWTVHGSRMMDTLAAGMKARAHVVVDQIKATMQEVRNHLPSSPAKVGPLSDIHKLKFGETIAQSIKPDAMVKAMRHATAATRAAANQNGFGAGLGNVVGRDFANNNQSKSETAIKQEARRSAGGASSNVKSGGTSAGAKGHGNININLGDVTLSAKDGMSQQEFEVMLEGAARKVKKIIDGEDARLNRRKFG